MAKNDTITALLDRYGRTFCAELDIGIERNEPMPLFRWLVTANLFAGRIRHSQAVKASRALWEKNWNTPEKFAAGSEKDRYEVLGWNGYGEYAERSARQLGEMTQHLIETYDGDLRQLRAGAAEDPAEERRLLKGFKGIGDVGADIFFKEIQGIWPEWYPFLDDVSRSAAGRLGLPTDAETLAAEVERADFVRLVTALTRAELENVGEEKLFGAGD